MKSRMIDTSLGSGIRGGGGGVEGGGGGVWVGEGLTEENTAEFCGYVSSAKTLLMSQLFSLTFHSQETLW